MTTTILETERLTLRELHDGDAAFVLELLNSPGWIRFIGDRGMRTEDEARDYLAKGPIDMYRRLGFGLYAVLRRGDAAPIGMCGLIKRDGLDDVDIGFAFLDQHAGQGYAFEAAQAVMAHGREVLGLQRIVAITSVDNDRSIRLLEKIGLRFEKLIPIKGEQVKLFATG